MLLAHGAWGICPLELMVLVTSAGGLWVVWSRAQAWWRSAFSPGANAPPARELGVWTRCDFCGDVMPDHEDPGFKVCGKCHEGFG